MKFNEYKQGYNIFAITQGKDGIKAEQRKVTAVSAPYFPQMQNITDFKQIRQNKVVDITIEVGGGSYETRTYYISEFIPIEDATSIEAMALTDNGYCDVMAFYTAQDQWTCIGTIPVQDTWKAVLQPRLITVSGEAGDLHEGETLSIPEGAKYIRITSVTDTSQLGSGQAPYVTVHFN